MIVAFAAGFVLIALAFVGTIADWFDTRDADVRSTRAYTEALDAVRRAAR